MSASANWADPMNFKKWLSHDTITAGWIKPDGEVVKVNSSDHSDYLYNLSMKFHDWNPDDLKSYFVNKGWLLFRQLRDDLWVIINRQPLSDKQTSILSQYIPPDVSASVQNTEGQLIDRFTSSHSGNFP